MNRMLIAASVVLLILSACGPRESVLTGEVVRLQGDTVAISDGGRCIQDEQNAIIYPGTVKAVDLGTGDEGKRRLWMQYIDGKERTIQLD